MSGSDGEDTPVTLTKDEALKRDLDGIDQANVIEGGRGRRVRHKVQRYEDEVFASDEYRKMILCDVPDDEVANALESDDDNESGVEEDSDASYEESENEEESEESDSCKTP